MTSLATMLTPDQYRLAYLPFHMLLAYPIASQMPVSKEKQTMIQVFFHVFYLVQYLIEHFADHLPFLADAGPFLVPVALSSGPIFFYQVYKKTSRKNAAIFWTVAFHVFVVSAKAAEYGFPKDTGAEQILACQDPEHNFKHLQLHIVFAIIVFASYSLIPNNVAVAAKTADSIQVETKKVK